MATDNDNKEREKKEKKKNKKKQELDERAAPPNETKKMKKKNTKKKQEYEEPADPPIEAKKTKEKNVKRKHQQPAEEGEGLDHDEKVRAKQNKRSKHNVVTDERFASVHYDPRFQRVPKKEAKVAIDSRFVNMLKDKSFSPSSAPVDKRGRPKEEKKNSLLDRYYHNENEDEEKKEEEDRKRNLEVEASEDEGEGEESSSTSTDDDEDEFDFDDDEQVIWLLLFNL